MTTDPRSRGNTFLRPRPTHHSCRRLTIPSQPACADSDRLGFSRFSSSSLTSVFKPLSAMLVLVWAWRSHTPWREIGYVRPKSWLGTLAVGILFGCAFKLLMKAIVMPLLGAPAINSAYHYLVGNRAALPGVVFTMIVSAGFAEETLFRGYLFERLGKLFGTGAGAKVSIVLLTLRVVCPGPLRQSRASWRRTGDDYGSRLRDDLRHHGPDLDGDVRACCVRSCGGRDNLLEPRSRGRSPCVQIAAVTRKEV